MDSLSHGLVVFWAPCSPLGESLSTLAYLRPWGVEIKTLLYFCITLFLGTTYCIHFEAHDEDELPTGVIWKTLVGIVGVPDSHWRAQRQRRWQGLAHKSMMLSCHFPTLWGKISCQSYHVPSAKTDQKSWKVKGRQIIIGWTWKTKHSYNSKAVLEVE